MHHGGPPNTHTLVSVGGGGVVAHTVSGIDRENGNNGIPPVDRKRPHPFHTLETMPARESISCSCVFLGLCNHSNTHVEIVLVSRDEFLCRSPLLLSEGNRTANSCLSIRLRRGGAGSVTSVRERADHLRAPTGTTAHTPPCCHGFSHPCGFAPVVAYMTKGLRGVCLSLPLSLFYEWGTPRVQKKKKNHQEVCVTLWISTHQFFTSSRMQWLKHRRGGRHCSSTDGSSLLTTGRASTTTTTTNNNIIIHTVSFSSTNDKDDNYDEFQPHQRGGDHPVRSSLHNMITFVSSSRPRRQHPGSRTTTTVGATTRLVWIWNVIELLACWTIAVFGIPALDHSSLSGDDVRLMTLESLSSSASSFQFVLRNSPSDSGGTTTTRTRRRHHHHIREDDNLSHQLVVYLTDSPDMVPSLLQPHPDKNNTNGVVVVGPSMMMMTNRGDADYNNLTITFWGTNNTTNNNPTRTNTLATTNDNNNQTTTSPQYRVEFPTRVIGSDNPPALEWRPKSRAQQRRDTKHRHLDDDCYERLGTRTKTTKSHHCESSHVAKAMEFPVCNLFHERSVPHTLRQSPTLRLVGYVRRVSLVGCGVVSMEHCVPPRSVPTAKRPNPFSLSLFLFLWLSFSHTVSWVWSMPFHSYTILTFRVSLSLSLSLCFSLHTTARVPFVKRWYWTNDLLLPQTRQHQQQRRAAAAALMTPQTACALRDKKSWSSKWPL